MARISGEIHVFSSHSYGQIHTQNVGIGEKTWKKSDPPVRDEAPPGEGNRGGFRTGRKAAAEPPWSGLSVLVPTKGEGDGDESWKPRCTNPSPPLWALEVTTPTVKFFTQKVSITPAHLLV